MKTKRTRIYLGALVLLCLGNTTPVLAAKTAGTLSATSPTPVKSPTVIPDQLTIEKNVREYFKNTPVMIEIARCESKFRQYTDGGSVLRSSGMIGVFQFYESIHAPAAKVLGFDLATVDGNLGYAKHVYSTEGTTPWNGSRYCWETVIPPTSATTTLTVSDAAHRAKLLEQITILTKLIILLQKRLAVV